MFTFSRLAARRVATSTRRNMAEMPVPQSRNAKLWEGHPTNEGWETTVMWLYPVSVILFAAAHGLAPETGIRAWAQQEARARLELKAQGKVDFEFGKHYQSLEKNQEGSWDKFTEKAVRMTDEDDDDDDE
jgi:hypothetical protein